MRLYVISATGVRTSDAPFLLVEALRRAGHDTSLVPVDTDLPSLAAVGWRVGGAVDRVYRASFQRHVRKLADRDQPDGVIVYGSNWSLDPDTIDHLRFRVGAQVALWEVNQRVFGGHQSDAMYLYDHVFCLDSYYVPLLRAGGLRCVEHLCAAADPYEHRPMQLDSQERERYQADLSFVGTYHPNRADHLRALSGSGLSVRIYGQGWERCERPVADWVRSEPVYGRKKTVVYSASRLVFHERGAHMLNGENFRVFEAAACGSVAISRPSPDLLRCFEPNEETLVFDQVDEFVKTAAWWIDHPAALQGVAQAARRRVLAEHTYDHRVAIISDHLAEGRHR